MNPSLQTNQDPNRIEEPVIDASLIATSPSNGYVIPVWARWMIAFFLWIIGGGLCVGVYFVGMLFLMFSLDGASSSDLPKWLEPMMLVGWPIGMGIAVTIPPLLYGCGFRIHIPIIAAVLGIILIVGMLMGGWIATLASISN